MDSLYFKRLNKCLQSTDRLIPRLVIDLDLLDDNINRFLARVDSTLATRIVVKSLPSWSLISYLMDRLATNKLMVFHQPILSDIASKGDSSLDILMGKPMPSKTAGYFYKHHVQNAFDPFGQIQWLVDTKTRVEEYLALAKQLNARLRLNVEIDVGLRRGGISNTGELEELLQLFADNRRYIDFAGFMGYDTHIIKVPKLVKSIKKSYTQVNHRYQSCIQLVQDKFSELYQDSLCFNGAGSSTFDLYTADSALTEVSAGSCFVKPLKFDFTSLTDFKPACFIATPILKAFKGTSIPALESFSSVMSTLQSKHRRSYFIYGGFWKASFCYPPEMTTNTIFGPSTNQSMTNAPERYDLSVDDFVFLRPHQSEFVFLQFGPLLCVRKHQIVDEWILLENN